MFRVCCGNQQLTPNEHIVEPSNAWPALAPAPNNFTRPCCEPSDSKEMIGVANASGDWIISSEAIGELRKPDPFKREVLGDEMDAVSDQILSLTVERHGKAKWGIDIEWRNRANLRIVSVKEGIISQWNIDNPSMRVDPGDLIVEINGVVNSTERLVEEISSSTKLTMRVQKKHNLLVEAVCIVAEEHEDFPPLNIFPGHKVYDVDFFEHDMMLNNLKQYYTSCRDFGLSVTMSCFSVWNESGETNGAAKVVPAVPLQKEGCGDESVRIFVFDANLNLHEGGGMSTKGCCNLRDVHTGKFVDFSVGQNGFACEKLFRRTLVHHSTEYTNVLVQVNILDVMTKPDYFSSILKKFAKPNESLLIYLDVYGTVIFDKIVDGATCYDFGLSEILLCAMFRFVELRPPPGGPVSFSWEAQPTVTLQQPESLLSLVQQVAKQDESFYQQFWSVKTCKRFLNAVASIADIAWRDEEPTITSNQFFKEYSENIDAMRQSCMGVGIADSWLRCHDRVLEEGHAVVVNSFNPEVQKFIRHLVPEPAFVPQCMVNYSLWRRQEVELLNAHFAK